jgi:hypothetical protein
MNKFIVMSISLSALLLTGCQTTQSHTFQPTPAVKKTERVNLSLSNSNCAARWGTCKSLILTAKNITSEVLKIDWNQSKLIEKGNVSNKGFMLIGDKYVDKNNAKQPTILLPGLLQKIELTPVDYVSYIESVGWGVYGKSADAGAVIAITDKEDENINYISLLPKNIVTLDK